MQPRVRLTAAAFALCLVGISLTSARQQQPTTFRAGVDLLTIETAVLDANGGPVRDLQPADFVVTVDGKPRKVQFARFFGAATSASGSGATPAADRAAPPAPAMTAAMPGLIGGRIVVFVVDRNTIRSGNEKTMLDTAGTVLDALTPADAVGLLGLPVGGIELTREHQRVRDALTLMTGTMPRQGMSRDRNVSWEEALAFEVGNTRVIGEVVERECYNLRSSESGLGNQCPGDLRNQAREMLGTGRLQVQTTIAALNKLLDGLAPLRASKHVVLLSGGMPFGQDLLPYYDQFARKAAQAQITLYAVHLDQPDSDVSDRTRVSSAFGGRDMSAGLTTMTGMTGGAFFNGIGRATGVFDRIRTEMSNFYEIGLETLPEDADGKARDISIKVNRPGLSVRARRQIMLPDATSRQADAMPALLHQPTDVAELSLAVTAYSTRGDDQSRLRVLLSAEIGATAATAAGQWGYVVLNEGNVVATGQQRLEPAPGGTTIMTSAKLVPGRYRLRFAAVDGDGKRGIVDLPLTVGLRTAGALQISDLVVGVAEGGKLQPRSRITQGAAFSALLELLSADPARLEKSRAVLEIIPAGTADAVQRVLMAARTGLSDAVLVNSAQIETSRLAPGRYIASAIAMLDTQPVGRVSQPFEVIAASTK